MQEQEVHEEVIYVHPDLLAMNDEGYDLRLEPSNERSFDFSREAPFPLHFGCRLVSMRCLFKNKKGQCEASTDYGVGYCPTHLERLFGLRIAESKIEGGGMGVFATRSLPQGNPKVAPNYCRGVAGEVCSIPYWGEIITEAEGNKRYGSETAPYGMEIENSTDMIDAACLRGFGSIINHPPKGKKANCRIAHRGDGYPSIEIVQPVKKGEELYLNYGSKYWAPSKRRARHTTKRGITSPINNARYFYRFHVPTKKRGPGSYTYSRNATRICRKFPIF